VTPEICEQRKEVYSRFGFGGFLLAALDTFFVFSFVHCRVGVISSRLHVCGGFGSLYSGLDFLL